MNRKGFISISVIYSFFLVFLMLLLFIVNSYVNNRTLLKKIEKEIIDNRASYKYCDLYPNTIPCKLYNPSQTGTMNLLYYHDSSLTNGANDNSYRFAGTNPNNYICFGSTSTTCPANNLFRIIGQIPVDVVVDDGNLSDIKVKKDNLVKIIKNDYLIGTEMGFTKNKDAEKIATFRGPSGNQPSGVVSGFYWSSPDVIVADANNYSSNNKNYWSQSTLNTHGLNDYYISYLGPTWSDKIEKVMWKVGGNQWANIGPKTPNNAYKSEIINTISSTSYTDYKELPNKIGLIYVSDYAYAVPSSLWTKVLYSSDGVDFRGNDVAPFNWLYKGVNEWSQTRTSNVTNEAIQITNTGSVINSRVHQVVGAIRPTFYLKSTVELDLNHSGTKTDPYRIVL